MLTMLRLELVGLVLLACTQILTEHREFYGPRNQYGHRTGSGSPGSHHGARTREVHLKYGRLRGNVVQPKADNLQPVDVFLGVPYAEPPHRFEPPRTQTPWTGVRHFINFRPVCPQLLPSIEEEVDTARRQYLKRLLPFLQNQSEDCLYLNIYAPHQEAIKEHPKSHQNHTQKNSTLEKFPVIVFIHGESYEWNSGNPYDGTVLAAYGNIVFVTVNFRLGILGFLRPGTKDETTSNFGLLDQIAALVWLKDNIGQFGGDPNRITLLGHGTGAVLANLLLLSPIVNDLCKRAILMSGSALNPDSIGKAPLQITKQVAYALNCPQTSDEDLAACLKSRSVQDLLRVKIHKPKYVPAFAPLVNSAAILDKPINLMKNPASLARFDLMYGVTELEKYHVLPGVARLEGLSDSARDEFIRDSVKATHELEPDLILRKVLEHYEEKVARPRPGDEYEWNRDVALQVVSDSGVVAPIIYTANLHSTANPKSYMYVFSHQRSIRDKSLNDLNIGQTVHGDELPYVLGVPLDGEGYHLSAPYDEGEALLSKAMMDWWCNFAYFGNPNSLRPPPRRLSHLRDDFKVTNSPYDIDWPEYDSDNQMYFNLTTPPQIGRRYRAAEMKFWNDVIPHLLRRPKAELSGSHERPSRPPRPGLLDTFDRDYANATGPANVLNAQSSTTPESLEPPSNLGDGNLDKTNESNNKDEGRSSSAISLVIGFGVVFLLINATALVYLYHKRQRIRKKAQAMGVPMAPSRRAGNPSGAGNSIHEPSTTTMSKRSKGTKLEQQRELGFCNSTSKPDIRELIKSDKAYDNNSNFGRRSRENSSSTIDTRIKVREWIQQEIVHRCSPRFLRKTRETLQREHREKLMKQQQKQGDEDEDRLRQLDEELRRQRMDEEEHQIRVRPGIRPTKVSVAVDATPATRTDSVLNQIPIELIHAEHSAEYLNPFEDTATILGTSEYCEPADFHSDEVNEEEARGGANVVVIEHHHSRSDPLPMDKVPSYSASKAISSSARINESDSGSASSLYAKINPRMKSRLPVHQHVQPKLAQNEEATEVEVRSVGGPFVRAGSSTLPRLLTFGGVAPPPPVPEHVDVNVTSRETNPTPDTEIHSHEEALRTIKRRNYPKVLPDIEKRRSLPPNASFVVVNNRPQAHLPPGHRQPVAPPSPPPRIYGTSRSLDCVEDKDEEAEEDDPITVMPVTTNLHVGRLRKKTDSPKNQSVPSLSDTSDSPQLSSAASLPVCPIHGASRDPPVSLAKSEPRIVISPRVENAQQIQPEKDDPRTRSIDQPDCPRRIIPERGTKLPRIIIRPTNSTLPRSQTLGRPNKGTVGSSIGNNLQDNETYQRLLARRERLPLPYETSRIPMPDRRQERTEVVERVNDAAVTKL